jgi:hypothetical protein
MAIVQLHWEEMICTSFQPIPNQSIRRTTAFSPRLERTFMLILSNQVSGDFWPPLSDHYIDLIFLASISSQKPFKIGLSVPWSSIRHDLQMGPGLTIPGGANTLLGGSPHMGGFDGFGFKVLGRDRV